MNAARLVNRVVAVVLAVSLFALFVLIPVEVVRAALHHSHWVLPHETVAKVLARNGWDTAPSRAAFIVVTVLGLLLLALGLRRGKPTLVGMQPITDGVESGTTRRSLQRALRTTAARVDGVDGARVRVKRRRATVTARTSLRDPGGLDGRVREALDERLRGFGLTAAPSLAVRIKRKAAA